MRRLAVLALLLACSKRSEPLPAPPVAAAPVDAGHPDAALEKFRTASSDMHVEPALAGTAKTYMVSSEAPLATQVGRDVLAAGGNAVDAAVATAFALAVVHPSAGNLGGGGFAVIHVAPGKDLALDFRETAPAAATAEMYLDKNGKQTEASLTGGRASGVPGSVAGLFALHAKLGKKPWKELVAPAIKLAREGFVIDEHLHDGLVRRADRMAKFPATAAIWTPDKKPRATGDKVAIPDLAAVLERIADKGPDGFYKGETAAMIVAEMKRDDGLITAADLEGYKAIWRDPIHFSYRGDGFVTMPPPSSGGIVMAMTANVLRKVELGKLPWHGAEHVHWLVEAWRRGFAARNELLGDPTFVKDIPVARLISTDYADKLAATITERATPSKAILPLLEGTHTTNLSVVDGGGMAVALTTTLNTAYGSGVTVAGAGFLMNNEMDDFTTKPGSPNVFGLVQGVANKIEPGKRMLSSMSPTIIVDDKGAPIMVVGAGGGPRIITGVWQVISNVIDFKMAVAAAGAAPRLHHQHLPDAVSIEADAIDQDTDAALKGRGYTLKWGEDYFGAITAIVRTATGWEGTADRRNGGAAMGD